MKLDPEEQEILDEFDRGEWQPVPNQAQEIAKYVAAAKEFRKDRRVNLRISAVDLRAIQARAQEEGMPYQTLIGSVLHKYACGRLREQ